MFLLLVFFAEEALPVGSGVCESAACREPIAVAVLLVSLFAQEALPVVITAHGVTGETAAGEGNAATSTTSIWCWSLRGCIDVVVGVGIFASAILMNVTIIYRMFTKRDVRTSPVIPQRFAQVFTCSQ
jgi:hypothetical protein